MTAPAPRPGAVAPDGRPLRVVYDISTLGYSHSYPESATGVTRVVHEVARELSRRPEVELQFCSSLVSTLAPAARYLRGCPEFADVPLLNRRAAGPLLHGLSRMQSRLANTGPGWLARKARRLTGAAMGAMERARAPLHRRQLRGAGVYHSPLRGFPAAAEGMPGMRRVLTVHDLIPILHPEFFEIAGEHFMVPVIRSLRPDDWVVAVSESTRADLLTVRPDLHPDRVRVTPLAAHPDRFRPVRDPGTVERARARYGIPPGPYVLSLNTLEPRKNLDRLVRAFARLVAQERLDLRLVLVGARGWKTGELFRAVDEAGPARGRIVFAGYVDDADLAALYSGAEAFVYPSLYEGFGLPPLEAMQCGVPVITSNTSSLPEVVGDAGVQVDPRDVEALAGAILRVCGDEGLRERMRAASLARASEFTWARTAGLTLQAYWAAVGGN